MSEDKACYAVAEESLVIEKLKKRVVDLEKRVEAVERQAMLATMRKKPDC